MYDVFSYSHDNSIYIQQKRNEDMYDVFSYSH